VNIPPQDAEQQTAWGSRTACSSARRWSPRSWRRQAEQCRCVLESGRRWWGLEYRVGALRDGGKAKKWDCASPRHSSRETPVRPFGVREAGGIQIALEDVLGVGRHHHVDGLAFDDRHGRATQRAHQSVFIAQTD